MNLDEYSLKYLKNIVFQIFYHILFTNISISYMFANFNNRLIGELYIKKGSNRVLVE